MFLYQFAQDKGETRISADRLDENFARVKPLPQDGSGRSYSVTETPQGWKLELSPQGILPPAPESGTFVLASVNGEIAWLATEAC
jgi:hypothetical protein